MHRQPSKMSLHETNLSMRYQMMKLRLRLKQERPSTLQKALEIALELDSFQIASRQRYRVIRNVRTGGERQGCPPGRVAVSQTEGDGTNTQIIELVERMEELMRKWMEKLAVVAGRRRPPGKKVPVEEESECWKCGQSGHYWRNCPLLKARNKNVSKEAAGESSLPGTSERPETTKPWSNDQ